MKQTANQQLTKAEKTKLSREITNKATTEIENYLTRAGVKAWRHNVLPIPSKDGPRPGSKSGVPDVLFIYGGRGFNYRTTTTPGLGIFGGVEVKKGKDTLNPQQIGFHQEARKLGSIIITAEGDTVEEIFNDFLQKWLQITKTR